MEYLIVVPVEFYKSNEDDAFCESAFVEHLKMLQDSLSDLNPIIHIVCPKMSESNYQLRSGYLTKLNRVSDRIKVTTMFDSGIGRIKYNLSHLRKVYRALKSLVKYSEIVHSGPSNNIFQLFEFIAIWLAVREGKLSIFVMDIDSRQSAFMDYQTGVISRKSYLLRKFIYDPLLIAQIKYACKHCSLVLLKGKSLVDDYGFGRPNVKNILDVAHSALDVISQKDLEDINSKRDLTKLKLVYFGRLTSYKGIMEMMQAVDNAITQHNANVVLTIIGAGEQKQELEDVARNLVAAESIRFVEPIPYGPQLFSEIRQHDALLAAPQRQDTPRSVFDAMANGLAIVAYDTYYYKDLEDTGAVITVPWRDIEKLTVAITELAANMSSLKKMSDDARDFATVNTQEYWLELRSQWLRGAIKSSHHDVKFRSKE